MQLKEKTADFEIKKIKLGPKPFCLTLERFKNIQSKKNLIFIATTKANLMEQIKYFALGCFNFSVANNIPLTLSGNDYIINLSECLGKVTNISNIKIEADEDFKSSSFTIESNVPKIDEDEGYFPTPNDLNVTFNLFIPFRIQAKICTTEERFLATFSENFVVHIKHGYHFPVAIIEIVTPTKAPDSSESVRTVREFLNTQINQHQNCDIRFEFLGPSPFHLECSLKPLKMNTNSISEKAQSEKTWLFVTEEILKKGYDEISIIYNIEKFKKINDAFEYLMEEIADEFGYAYMCIQFRVIKIHKWDRIDILVKNLNDIHLIRGFKGFIANLFQRSSLVSELINQLVFFQTRDTWLSSIHQSQYKEIFSSGKQSLFKTYIDKEIEEKYSYPVKEVHELIKFHEKRWGESVSRTIVFLAAIFGGIVGAFFSKLL